MEEKETLSVVCGDNGNNHKNSCTNRISGQHDLFCQTKKAFTLAEVLITLAIIGVVAALTIPTLITNYQKKQYVTQLKKSYSNITNAFHTAMANDGVTDFGDTALIRSINGDYTNTTKGQADFTKELNKIFKILKTYENGDDPNEIEYSYLKGDNTETENFYKIYLADGSILTVGLN